MKMIQRIALILAPSEKGISKYGYTYLPPLSLGVLGGYLSDKNYDVSLYDLNMKLPDIYQNEEQFAFLYDKETILNYLNNKEDHRVAMLASSLLEDIPIEEMDIIGISCGADFSFFQLHSAFLLGKYIQKKYHIPVILGGNNITYLTLFQDTFHELLLLLLDSFPYIIKGPGEVVLSELLDILNGNSQHNPYDLDGMVYRKDGKIHTNREHPPIVTRPNWCNLPMEYYYLKINHIKDTSSDKAIARMEAENRMHVFKWPFFLTHYVSVVRKQLQDEDNHEFTDKLVLPYIFNYHCPYSCAFCSESDTERKEVILGEVNKVVEDILWLTNTYHTNYFYFLNNAANASAKFIDEFCRQLIERQIHIVWSDCARFNNMTYERLKLMKEAGCCKLVFGFETASQKLITLVEKKIDLSQAVQVMEWCKELGIWTDLEVIIGLPQENEEDFLDTVKFVTDNKQYINYMTINEFFVVPNSKIGRNPKKYGIELVRNVIDYDKILKRSWNYFKDKKGKQTGNFKIYKFNEINGRKFNEIMKDTKEHIRKMNDLQNKEFAEVEGVYRILEKRISARH